MTPTDHIDGYDLDLYALEKLDAEQASSIRSHVQKCGVCKDRLVTGFLARLAGLNHKQPGNSSSERRVAHRLKSGEHGSIQSICPLSFERPPVEIVDVSKDGFGLLMTSFLAERTIVQIHIGTTISVGTVISCQKIGDNQFRAGIRVQHTCELRS